jgi:hypothetical protein
MTRYLLIAALACAGVLSLQTSVLAQAAAPRAAPAGQACLRQRNIYDFQLVPGNRSLIVTDLSRRRYRLNFISKCYNIQHQFGLRFKTFGVGSLSCVARGDSVLLRDPVGPDQCIIRDIEYQTPDMDRADYDAAQGMRQRR